MHITGRIPPTQIRPIRIFLNIDIGSNSLVICSKQTHIGLCPSRTDLYDPFLSELYEFEDMVS